MKAFYTILLLILSNAFMTLAWYGHLKFKDMEWSKSLGLFSI
ncbi:MAG: DMT family protein, partial [Saprospiraceae bacterium]